MKIKTIITITMLSMTGCIKSSNRNGLVASKYFTEPAKLDLIKCIESENLAGIERCVNSGTSPNIIGSEEITPLFWAIFMNKFKSWSKLLDLGANPNFKTTSKSLYEDGYSAMYYAAIAEDERYIEEALKRGGDPNLKEKFKERTVIFAAVDNKRINNIKSLVTHGADVNFRGMGQNTPLMTAVLNDDFEIAEVLLKLGADASIPDDLGNTVSSLIKRHSNPEAYPGAKKRVVQDLRKKGLW